MLSTDARVASVESQPLMAVGLIVGFTWVPHLSMAVIQQTRVLASLYFYLFGIYKYKEHKGKPQGVINSKKSNFDNYHHEHYGFLAYFVLNFS